MRVCYSNIGWNKINGVTKGYCVYFVCINGVQTGGFIRTWYINITDVVDIRFQIYLTHVIQCYNNNIPKLDVRKYFQFFCCFCLDVECLQQLISIKNRRRRIFDIVKSRRGKHLPNWCKKKY